MTALGCMYHVGMANDKPEGLQWMARLRQIADRIHGYLETLDLPGDPQRAIEGSAADGPAERGQASATAWRLIGRELAPYIQQLRLHIDRAFSTGALGRDDHVHVEWAEDLYTMLEDLAREVDAPLPLRLATLRVRCQERAEKLRDALGQSPEDDYLLTVTQVAKALQCHPSTVTRYCNKDRLDARGQFKGRRISAASVKRHIETNLEGARRASARHKIEQYERQARPRV